MSEEHKNAVNKTEQTTDPKNQVKRPGYAAARCKVDVAIGRLWIAFRELSGFGEEAMTPQDCELWGEVTGHKAIQDKLDNMPA